MRDEFVVGAALAELVPFVKDQGWRESGRADWTKKDGTTVYYLRFSEQIEALTSGATVHVVGAGASTP